MFSDSTTLAASDVRSGASRPRAGFARRAAILVYGVAVYALFLATFLYLIAFVAGVFVPKHIDSGASESTLSALLVNGAFLAAFVVQHVIMARPAFKRWWTRIVPAAAERSTFVLAAVTILIAMVWQWRAVPTVVWHVDGFAATVLWSVSALGWATVLVATFLIDHFHLFGLRQSVMGFLGREERAPKFVERSLYRLMRHPLMTGFMLAFWATPHMTVGHLFFAVMCTGYALAGTWIEERDLIAAHGDSYRDYRKRVRGFLPIPRRTSAA